MSRLTENILLIAQSLPEGGIFSPKELLHLGSRAATNQALRRLVKSGKVLRISQGMYVMPVVGKFGCHAPSLELIISNMEIKTGETIVESGATAANALGLTTQVPVRTILITSGRPKKLSFGKHIVEVRHGARWQYIIGKGNAGSAIRALGNIGPKHAGEAILNLRKKLSTPEWEAIMAVRANLPVWMAAAIRGMVCQPEKQGFINDEYAAQKNERRHEFSERIKSGLADLSCGCKRLSKRRA